MRNEFDKWVITMKEFITPRNMIQQDSTKALTIPKVKFETL